MARPHKYSDDTASEILNRIAHGESVRSILSEEHMPSQPTFYSWITDDSEFSKKYARAREIAADVAFDVMQEIADETNNQDVQVAKLRIDTLKWRLARQSPRKYGERQAIEHTGAEGGPIEVKVNLVRSNQS